MSTFELTTEQAEVLAHPVDCNGRVLAGPGTGKSETVLRLARKLKTANGSGAVHVITFTRAATAELALKATSDGPTDMESTTLHAFCLSLLMRHSSKTDLPKPLRVPDDWEADNLIRPDLARRLRSRGLEVDKRLVSRLEREMSARWESLDDELELYSDVNPEMRNGYLAAWNAHRAVYGYSLFAEMPLKAADLARDHDELGFDDLRLLVVDEYQDLNRCDIELLQALETDHGVSILAVGDDDQSIYGFRMADPSGIRRFDGHFADPKEYQLSRSMRCARAILAAASTLIETSPTRPPKKRLRPHMSNPEGVFAYLAFRTHTLERKGVADLVERMVGMGLVPSEIVVMMRGDHNRQWSDPLRDMLTQRGIPAIDVEAALAPLRERETRRALAIARLVASLRDDLAWWALLMTTNGIAANFINAVANEALANGERFAERLRRIASDPVAAGSVTSWNKAVAVVRSATAFVEKIDIEGVAPSDAGWATFIVEMIERFGVAASSEFQDLAMEVGLRTPFEEGLSHYLNQLEPVAKDLALLTEGVAIMSMQRSKGLTFRGAVVMGVENGVIPSPRAADVEEERRLLYVL